MPCSPGERGAPEGRPTYAVWARRFSGRLWFSPRPDDRAAEGHGDRAGVLVNTMRSSELPTRAYDRSGDRLGEGTAFPARAALRVAGMEPRRSQCALVQPATPDLLRAGCRHASRCGDGFASRSRQVARRKGSASARIQRVPLWLVAT